MRHVQAASEIPAEMLEALAEPSAHVGDASAAAGIETIQTHISHLFLTGDRVYKLRKSIELPFLSFATRALRNADCLDEVSLNRRLAPDVYLGVAPIYQNESGRWEIGPPGETLSFRAGTGEPFEHCVVMRRLREGSDTGSMLRDGTLGPAHIDAVADMVAEFHDRHGLGTPAPGSVGEWLSSLKALVTDSVRLACDSGCAELDAAELESDRERLLALLASHRTLFEQRLAEGRFVDGHADLRLEHIFFEAPDAKPIAIDCVEFDASLRRIDGAAEVAFFAMDLAYRERADLAERFLGRYAALRDDFQLYGVVDYYIAHRALVRASVAGVAAMEEEIDPAGRRAAAASALAHARLARDAIDGPGRAGLVLTCGMVGTGKSTVATAVAEVLGGTVISSDRTRKHLAGLTPATRAEARPDEGIYTPESTRRVYGGLLERALPVLESGRTAVLDATWSRAEWRDGARHWAQQQSQRPLLVEVCCDEATTLLRLARRERDPARVSDAGPAFLSESARTFEAPEEWPEADHLVIWTNRDGWRESLRLALDDWTARSLPVSAQGGRSR